MAKIPLRVGYALHPKRLFHPLFEGWPPYDTFQEIWGEVAVDQALKYADEMERLEQKALRNMERALDGDLTDSLQYKAAKDIIERRHGKPTERIQKDVRHLNVNVELSADDLAAKRRLLSGAGLGISSE